MTLVKVNQRHYPKGDLTRRGMALAIDFFGAWLLSSMVRSNEIGIQFAQIFVFIFVWLVFRVVVVYNNQGQSLGRWAFDLKILEVVNGEIVNRIPQFQTLLLREGIICCSSLLLSIFLGNIILNPAAVVLLLPLIIDGGAALSDTQMRQAFHDRFLRTVIVSSRRGYSLDIKIKRLVAKFPRNMR
ncbi:RDD family protein [Aphanizomenon sp. CS-733/32]|uniref:RDD family protein n=1 Tax=Aphanizomenon sp. CS-733/32 TaxID=3021715 RepID=UPI00232DF02E|nr:RDD family protein [Aphanizomenon sp. CS-733/32]MDB9310939.1 RDD family protein [Aphanizomenon sp. CS-733/32]